MILTLKNPCRSGVRMGWNMRVDYALTNYYIKKSWLNSEIWFFSCMHCSGLRGLQVSSIMQHWALFVRIKESLLFLSGINPLFTSSCHIQSSNSVVWLIFSTKILCKMMLWAFSFYHESSMELPPQLADECFMVFFLWFERKTYSPLHSPFQMLNCTTSTSKPPIEVSVYEKRNHLFGVQFLLLSKPRECCVCLEEEEEKKDVKLNAEKQFKMPRSFGCLSCTFGIQHGDFLGDHGWEKYTTKNSLTHRPACCATLM